jgi:hypothetical protein
MVWGFFDNDNHHIVSKKGWEILSQSNNMNKLAEVKDYSKENLDVTHYRNGDPIPQVQGYSDWSSLAIGAWCYYDNDPEKGILYNWYAVNDPRGLAPIGWRIPMDKEMSLLNLKDSPSYLGYRSFNGFYYGLKFNQFCWSSTSNGEEYAWYNKLEYLDLGLTRSTLSKKAGFSVRCVKDQPEDSFKKFTVSQWLEESMLRDLTAEQKMSFKDLFKSAREMEKDLHKKTWFDSIAQFDSRDEISYDKSFEEYYNENHGIGNE